MQMQNIDKKNESYLLLLYYNVAKILHKLLSYVSHSCSYALAIVRYYAACLGLVGRFSALSCCDERPRLPTQPHLTSVCYERYSGVWQSAGMIHTK